MLKEPLGRGELAAIVRHTFERAGITEFEHGTPAELFLQIARWDGLLNPMELKGLRMVVRQLSPMQIEGFDDS